MGIKWNLKHCKIEKILLSLSLLISLLLTACTTDSSFSILFIDVGQGDSTLVECDGKYMLIDGGSENEGDTVYNILKEKDIKKLDILAISHMHEDHIGGLPKALSYASKIKLTIANTDYDEGETFKKLQKQLDINGAKIKVPKKGKVYFLGSAEVEVVYNSSKSTNDSLVLLITYKNTKFLFTGDIETEAQRKIANDYNDTVFKVNVMKMPHHGADTTEYRFINTFMPDYAVISVGINNHYGHPGQTTLDRLEQANSKIYRTDENGNIIVYSDGKSVRVETTK